jgi:hypothetical protein
MRLQDDFNVTEFAVVANFNRFLQVRKTMKFLFRISTIRLRFEPGTVDPFLISHQSCFQRPAIWTDVIIVSCGVERRKSLRV